MAGILPDLKIIVILIEQRSKQASKMEQES